MKRNRITSLILAALFVLSAILCGCQSQNNSSVRKVEYSAKAHIINKPTCDQITVYSENSVNSVSEQKLLLEAEIDGEECVCEIGAFPAAAFWDGVLIPADFDGDGCDEILINSTVNSNMTTITRIYKYDGNGLYLFQDLDKLDLDLVYEFEPSRIIKLSDKRGSFSIDIDISDFSDEAFDEDGKYTIDNESSLVYGSLSSVELLNGKCFSAVVPIKDSYMNSWGSFRFVFAYNDDIGQMEITDVVQVNK